MRTFKYFVYNDDRGEIQGIQVREIMETGGSAIRRNLRSGNISKLDFFALKPDQFREVSRKDADIVFRLCDKELDCDTMEAQILGLTMSS